MFINESKLPVVLNIVKPSDVIKKITNDLFEEASSPKDVTIEQHNHAAIQAIIKYLDDEFLSSNEQHNHAAIQAIIKYLDDEFLSSNYL